MVELAANVILHRELGEHRREARSPRPACPVAGREDTDYRGKLREAALLATDSEHLNAVHARGVAADEQLAPFARALRGRLGLGEVTLE